LPVTTPVVPPTDATVLLLLVQAPPEVALVSAVVAPIHAFSVPPIVAGSEFTVIVETA
jgi:hypothetical protein